MSNTKNLKCLESFLKDLDAISKKHNLYIHPQDSDSKVNVKDDIAKNIGIELECHLFPDHKFSYSILLPIYEVNEQND